MLSACPAPAAQGMGVTSSCAVVKLNRFQPAPPPSSPGASPLRPHLAPVEKSVHHHETQPDRHGGDAPLAALQTA